MEIPVEISRAPYPHLCGVFHPRILLGNFPLPWGANLSQREGEREREREQRSWCLCSGPTIHTRLEGAPGQKTLDRAQFLPHFPWRKGQLWTGCCPFSKNVCFLFFPSFLITHSGVTTLFLVLPSWLRHILWLVISKYGVYLNILINTIIGCSHSFFSVPNMAGKGLEAVTKSKNRTCQKTAAYLFFSRFSFM